MKATRVANIGSRGRRRRLLGGGFWLLVGTIATWTIVHERAGRWYALLVVPFTLAALGYFQARDYT